MDQNGFKSHNKDLTAATPVKNEDLLTEEFPVNIPNQSFALLSYLGPKTKPSTSWYGLRIYGTFATLDEANRAAMKARERGFKSLDLFVVDICHGFFPMPPPCESSIADVQYDSDVLGKLMRQEQNDAKDACARVANRAAGAMEVKSSSELINEMALTAVEVFQQHRLKLTSDETDNHKELTDMLVKRFKRISDFVV